MALSKKYNPIDIEDKWYKYWLEEGFFSSKPNEKESYTVVMPPPNVTGILHMGHMLNNTIQDVLIRSARLNGKNACWVPGTDHASIATEAKVVNWIKEEFGLTKEEIGREKFLEYAWQWKEKYGGAILQQLKKLGCSCDWNRTKFTLDEDLSVSVNHAFIDLFKKGLIYRGERMINWDPSALTNISDEEVNYEERNGKLYYIKYKTEDTLDFLQIATTRPETIFGDTAICVNPNDERFNKYIGTKVFVPIVDRLIPVVADDYVDIEFGTGCLKITPAHDFNDYEIGKRHQLESINIFNPDATLNDNAGDYSGLDRDDARKKVVKDLESKGLLIKSEDYTNKVGTSERTGSVVEPRLSTQWFVEMEGLAKPALDAVENKSLKLHPNKFTNTYKHWLENIRDWNISRQLWWGHRIPVYYFGDKDNDFVVAQNREEALLKAKEKVGNGFDESNLRQDEDVLDTWFSSWLWPMSVFDGIKSPGNPDLNYYYPTSDLVTGPDIIFFWVARMVMAGYAFSDKLCFENVYFTGIVRDKQRRKMSKQLGNSPDPIKLIEEYGADGVRVGLLMSAAAGNDVLFDESLCLQGRNFANKIWNAFSLINMWDVKEVDSPKNSIDAITWFENKLNQRRLLIDDHMSKYRISDALLELYKLVWDDFCSWYLEAIKPTYQSPIDNKTYDATFSFFNELMKLLHPFMPFITEELWHELVGKTEEKTVMFSSLRKIGKVDEDVLHRFDLTANLVTAIRSYRKEQNIPNKEAIEISADLTSENKMFFAVVEKLGNVSKIDFVNEHPKGAATFIVDVFSFSTKMQILDKEEELIKTKKEIEYLEGFLKSVDKKLSNERFRANAPEAVINSELKKADDAKEKIIALNEKLNNS